MGDRKLAEVYNGWGEYQEGMVKALSPLTAEQLGIRPAPELWSVRTIASHIAAVRVWWFHAWMGEGGSEFDGMEEFDEGEEAQHRSAPEIVSALESTWSLVESCLQRWSSADLDPEFQRPVPNAAGERPIRSRGWIVYHVLEHDVHHGGEISICLGMHGIPTVMDL